MSTRFVAPAASQRASSRRPAGPATLAGVTVGEAVRRPATRRTLFTETILVLGVSLGASGIWSLLSLVDKLTRQVALNKQTTAMNSSVTPDRPWLLRSHRLR